MLCLATRGRARNLPDILLELVEELDGLCILTNSVCLLYYQSHGHVTVLLTLRDVKKSKPRPFGFYSILLFNRRG